MNEREENYISH